MFQHLYQYAVYAIADDIQADVSYASIRLHLKILSQLSLPIDVVLHDFSDSLSQYQYAFVVYRGWSTNITDIRGCSATMLNQTLDKACDHTQRQTE